jgi:hypothetical protein
MYDGSGGSCGNCCEGGCVGGGGGGGGGGGVCGCGCGGVCGCGCVCVCVFVGDAEPLSTWDPQHGPAMPDPAASCKARVRDDDSDKAGSAHESASATMLVWEHNGAVV